MKCFILIIALQSFNLLSTNEAAKIPLIIDGHNANEGQFPWHAAIYIKFLNKVYYICGGSLITASHVLTAAHCFLFPSEYYISLGTIKLVI